MANLHTPRLARMRSFFKPEPPTLFYLRTPRIPVEPEFVRGLDTASFASGLSKTVNGWAAYEDKDAHIVFTGWTALQIVAACVLDEVHTELRPEPLLEALGVPLHATRVSQQIPIEFDLRGKDAQAAMAHIRQSLSFPDGFLTITGLRSRLWLLHETHTSQSPGPPSSDRAKYAVAMKVLTQPGLTTETVELTVIDNRSNKRVQSSQAVTCESLIALFRDAVQDLIGGRQLSAAKLVAARYTVHLLEIRYRYANPRDQVKVYQQLSRSHEAALSIPDLSADALHEAVRLEQSWWKDTAKFFAGAVPGYKETLTTYVKHFELIRKWLEKQRQLPFDTGAFAHSLAKSSPFEVVARSSLF
ncbi:hypothetical protein JCM10295v2_000839 [Rhodotorula toruloides]